MAPNGVLTYECRADGRFHPVWDIRIAELHKRPVPDLWPLFGAPAGVPVLPVRGAVSTVLLPATVTRMQAERPVMEAIVLEGIGHALLLTERDALAASKHFLTRAG